MHATALPGYHYVNLNVYQMKPPLGYLSRLEILALSLPELISQLECSLLSNDFICNFSFGFRDLISMILSVLKGKLAKLL
jgi:hypothetical protein